MAAPKISEFASKLNIDEDEFKKRIKSDFGVDPNKAFSDKNLEGVNSALRGAQTSIQETGDAPQSAVEAKELDPVGSAPKKESQSDRDNQQILYKALIAAIPTVIGAAVGGSQGGAIGAAAGSGALQNLNEMEKDREKRDFERGQKKAELALKERETKKDEEKLGLEKTKLAQEKDIEERKLLSANELKKMDRDIALGKTKSDKVEGLRKEYLGNQLTKETQQVIGSFQKIQEVAKEPTAAGDLSLIFSYMKMLDPGSVVREGEFASAQNAAGIPDRVRNAYNNALKGERLNPQQREDFLGQAENIANAQLKKQEAFKQNFGNIASKYELPLDEITLGFGEGTTEGIKQGKSERLASKKNEEMKVAEAKKTGSLLDKLSKAFTPEVTSANAASTPAQMPDFDKMSDEELKAYLQRK